MTEKRMTKKDWFEVLAGIVEASAYERKDEALAFIDHEVNMLNRKTTKSGPSKTQQENAEIRETIKQVMADFGKPVQIADLMTDERLEMYSGQKLNALVAQLKHNNEVVRTEIKKKAYFSLVE